MRLLCPLVAAFLLSGCAAPTVRRVVWPPPNRPEWEKLDPGMCHPQPDCVIDPSKAEWPGVPGDWVDTGNGWYLRR